MNEVRVRVISNAILMQLCQLDLLEPSSDHEAIRTTIADCRIYSVYVRKRCVLCRK